VIDVEALCEAVAAGTAVVVVAAEPDPVRVLAVRVVCSTVVRWLPMTSVSAPATGS